MHKLAVTQSVLDIANFSRGVRALKSKAKIIEVSGKTGQGIDGWVSWLSS